jgi:hypothetical protein
MGLDIAIGNALVNPLTGTPGKRLLQPMLDKSALEAINLACAGVQDLGQIFAAQLPPITIHGGIAIEQDQCADYLLCRVFAFAYQRL